MTIHTIEPDRRTLHGHFSCELPPVLTIDPGDTVRFRTLDAGWGVQPPSAPGPPSELFAPRTEGKDDGHALCGPIEIKGAQPGMVLEIQINKIQPGTWGWNSAGGWANQLNKQLGVAEGETHSLLWALDPDTLVGQDQQGHSLTLHPFMGVMGMPPNEPGIHSTGPPRIWGGNLDCKELIAGSTLFLPIPVVGGLFSVGDGHAVQGDGEVSGIAIECPMDRVDLTFYLREDLALSTPRAKTSQAWLTLGLHEDLNEATNLAINAMLDLMSEQFNLSRKEALALASLVVDLRITQIVNGTRGVHAMLPHGAIR
jgi:acetamidase/formamidase